MHRDYGDRTDRKHARLKYVVEEHGIDAFREEFQRRASVELKPRVEIPPLKHQDWLGVHEQGDGRYFFGMHVANGRVIDGPRLRYKTAIRKIVEALRPSVTLTPTQSIIFGDLSEQDVKAIRKTLKSYGLPEAEDLTAVRRYAMACPAQPTCGLALTESERVMEGILDDLEPEFERLGLEDEPLTIRMTGCPNGCARPYNAEIGLVGHKPGHCDVFLGGSLDGERLADHYATNVPRSELAATLRPLLEAWAEHRMPEEPFGDFYQRMWGTEESRNRRILTGARDNPARDRIEPELEQTVST
jgi:sulfite reductase beta subunit-like hemoprotein